MRDPEIRTLLHAHINATHPAGAVVIDEFGPSATMARADVAVLAPGVLHLYEIKSDADSVARLLMQVEQYGRICSSATLVVGEHLARRAIAIVPEWWGILRAGAGRLDVQREAGANPSPARLSVAGLLWRPEQLEELGHPRGRLTYHDRACMLSERLSLAEIWSALHRRAPGRPWKRRANLLRTVPAFGKGAA